MGVDYHVAIHDADWPTPAELNACMAELHYPVAIGAMIPSRLDEPLALVPESFGVPVLFAGEQLDLETSIVKLGPDSPYAYRLSADMPRTVTTLDDGTVITTVIPATPDGFVPADLNEDLRRLGASAPDFGDDDYVITLTFTMTIAEWRAGWFLMAGLIKCANGFGFEFQDGWSGTGDYADFLAAKAADPGYWE